MPRHNNIITEDEKRAIIEIKSENLNFTNQRVAGSFFEKFQVVENI